MKQMQTENNGEAELETEGPGGISFNNHFYYHMTFSRLNSPDMILLYPLTF